MIDSNLVGLDGFDNFFDILKMKSSQSLFLYFCWQYFPLKKTLTQSKTQSQGQAPIHAAKSTILFGLWDQNLGTEYVMFTASSYDWLTNYSTDVT